MCLKPSFGSRVPERVGCTLRDRRVWGGAIPVVAPLFKFLLRKSCFLGLKAKVPLSSVVGAVSLKTAIAVYNRTRTCVSPDPRVRLRPGPTTPPPGLTEAAVAGVAGMVGLL